MDMESLTNMRKYIYGELLVDEDFIVDEGSAATDILDEVSADVLTEMQRALFANSSMTLRGTLRQYSTTGRSDRILAVCRYHTLYDDRIPNLHDSNMLKVMCIPERYGYEVSGKIALARRIGMAHAALALYVSVNPFQSRHADRDIILSLDENRMYVLLEEKYPSLVDTFASHGERVVELHKFLDARGQTIDALMMNALKEYAESPSPALAEGVL